MFKKLLSFTKTGNTLFGDVVVETSSESGTFSHSHFEWRVKQTVDKSSYLIGVKMRPDGYAGPEGSPWNYINFDLATAIRLRDKLNHCIAAVEKAQSPSHPTAAD